MNEIRERKMNKAIDKLFNTINTLKVSDEEKIEVIYAIKGVLEVCGEKK